MYSVQELSIKEHNLCQNINLPGSLRKGIQHVHTILIRASKNKITSHFSFSFYKVNIRQGESLNIVRRFQ